MEVYPSIPWNSNYCWLDATLELLWVMYLHDSAPWRKLASLSFNGPKDPAYVWYNLHLHMEKRAVLYWTCPPADLPKNLQELRNSFGDILKDADLKGNAQGTLEPPWVGFIYVFCAILMSPVGVVE